MKTKKTSKFKAGDTIKCIKSFWNPETQTQVEEGYIVRNMTQFGIDCLSHPECWEKVDSNNEITIRNSTSTSEEIGEKIVQYCKKYEGTNKYNDILKAIEFGYNLQSI